MANDDMRNGDEPVSKNDIVFNCGVCGKSLVIDALGAGLAIICPDCGTELQVPQPDVAADAGAEKVERELTEISDVLSGAHEQIRALKEENEELQFRRRFLEKRYAVISQSLQSLRQEMTTIRTAMDQMDEIIKIMEDPSSGDTQPIA